MTTPTYHPAFHRLALLTCIATFPLIFMGGLVTSHQAGMSVPDWPNSYGYNMFLFPPRLWIGGILYEHTHRLMGTVVGMLSIALAIVAWKTEERAWARKLAYAVLATVIFQGILGGLRVVLVQLDLAVVHACLAQAFFCLTAAMYVVTSKWWYRNAGETSVAPSRRLFVLATIACLVIYLQLIAGALMRHYKAGLAIPDFPASYGRVLPPSDAAELQSANALRSYTLNLEPVTLGQIWLHFTHRIGAVMVTIAILVLTIHVFRTHRGNGALVVPATILIVLLAAQITLGILTVLKGKPADIATLHVAVGALTLVTAFVVLMRAAGLSRAGRTLSSDLRSARETVSYDSRTSYQPMPAA